MLELTICILKQKLENVKKKMKKMLDICENVCYRIRICGSQDINYLLYIMVLWFGYILHCSKVFVIYALFGEHC